MAHLPHRTDLNKVVKAMECEQLGIDTEARCTYCKREGHQTAACCGKGSPRVDSKKNCTPSDRSKAAFVDKLCGELHTEKAFWTEWREKHKHLHRSKFLAAAKAEIERKVALAGENPWEDEPGLPNALRRHLAAWAAIGASRTVISWLASGYLCKWVHTPEPVSFANGAGAHEYEPNAPENVFFKAELERQLKAGTYFEVKDPALQFPKCRLRRKIPFTVGEVQITVGGRRKRLVGSRRSSGRKRLVSAQKTLTSRLRLVTSVLRLVSPATVYDRLVSASNMSGRKRPQDTRDSALIHTNSRNQIHCILFDRHPKSKYEGSWYHSRAMPWSFASWLFLVAFPAGVLPSRT